jgi:hypothetical protein
MINSRYVSALAREDLGYNIDWLIESEYKTEIVKDFTSQDITRVIRAFYISMPWSENAMEDLASLHVSWDIIDKHIIKGLAGCIFKLGINSITPEMTGKVLAGGNKIANYEYVLDMPISVRNYCYSQFVFKLEKPMKFNFGIRGIQRRPL